MSEVEIKLLVVDDDAGAFTLVNQMLLTVKQLRVSIDWVDSYDKGVQAFRENGHDVYLVDYRLGSENGVNLLRKATELGIDAPIILLTAYGTYDVDLAVMRLGAMDYLDKRHLSPELLERSIRYAVERKKNERELKRLHERITALEQLKTDMIRVAAHDLKSPISSILLNVHMLRKLAENAPEELKEKLITLAGKFESNAQMMRAITTNVLSMEQIEDLHRQLLYDVDFKQIITNICPEYTAVAAAKSQKFLVQVPDEAVHVLSDTTLLSQMVTNLIENAIKYTPEGKTITVRLQKLTDKVNFEVEDTGEGIRREDVEKLFQPFTRLKASDGTGSGLGLYLVKSIVLRHNGSVIFKTEPGKGSTFGFSLPMPAVIEENKKQSDQQAAES